MKKQAANASQPAVHFIELFLLFHFFQLRRFLVVVIICC
jgi:hypothetical protein